MRFSLPDFLNVTALNDLRTRMGAPLTDYNPVQGTERRISHRDLERLRTTGITVDASEVETLPDGTFTYQGVPILLYIMAYRQYREAQKLPKYHISNCQTWDSMKAQGRQDRYVACTRVDGLFEMELMGLDGKLQRSTERLEVCKNCLDRITWKGFNFESMDRAERNRIFRAFSLSDFFETRKQTFVREKPKWTAQSFPGGSYTDDFDEISSRARAAAKWRCQEVDCNRLLAQAWQRRYLHVHHVNGVKADNRPENLRVLCLECHANQPSHAHMKKLPDYLEFQRLFSARS